MLAGMNDSGTVVEQSVMNVQRSLNGVKSSMSEGNDSLEDETQRAACVYVLKLPFEMIVSIVENADHCAWGSLAMVNNRFRAAVRRCIRSFTDITLSQFFLPARGLEAEDGAIFLLQTLSNVQRLSIPATVLPAIRSQVACRLSHLKNLKSLDLSGCLIRERVLCKLLRSLPQLEELKLRGAFFTTSPSDYDEATLLFMLEVLKESQSFSFRSLRTIRKPIILQISTLKQLRKLDVYGCCSGRDVLGILISELPYLMQLEIQFQLQ